MAIDYAALAAQYGGTIEPAPTGKEPDYAALAAQYGGTIEPAAPAQPAAPAAPVPTRADAAAQSQERAAERAKLQQQAQKNSFLQRLAGSAASTVDIAPKAVAGIIEPISYAIARPFNTPEEAKAVSESAGRAVPTLGRLFGLEGQPEYTDPFTAASEAISKVVAPYTQAATQAIGEATDTSPIDISNLAALAGMGAGIPVARRAPSAVTQATEAPGRLGGAIQEGAINAADFLVPGRGDIIRRNIEAKKLEKAQAAQAANEANNAAIDLGLKIVPRDLRIADPDTAFKVAATHNARKLAEDLFFTFAGIPKNNKVNSAAFESAREELAKKGYGPIYDAPPVSTPSPETISKIDDIRRSSDFEKDKRGRPVPPAPVQNTLNQISEIFGKSEVSPGKVLKLVTDLRSNTKAYRDSLWRGDFIAHDKSIVPEAQIKLADTLENWLDNNIPQKDVQKYRETRQKLRELYDLEASTDFNTGTINPEQYVKRTASGEIKDTASWQYKLGTAAGMYPESFKLPEPRSASSVLTQTASRATVPGIAAGAILQNMGLDGWTIAAGALGAVMTAELAARQLGKSAARVPGTRMPVLPSVQRAAEATRQAQEDMQRSAAGATGGVPTGMGMVPRVAEGDFIRTPRAETTAGTPNWTPYVEPGATPRPDVTVKAPENAPRQLESKGYTEERAIRENISKQQGAEVERRIMEQEAKRGRQPTKGGKELVFDEKGKLVEAKPQGNELKLSTADVISKDKTALSKIADGRMFDLSASEKVAFKVLKRKYVTERPEFANLNDAALSLKMLDELKPRTRKNRNNATE